mmetsp:Transcript_32120/g.88582  ORF Transcript_32120/g.88582 Transcript_32120/m.88582 type:complete len:146 (-) Transcript_32120:384-821(-)
MGAPVAPGWSLSAVGAHGTPKARWTLRARGKLDALEARGKPFASRAPTLKARGKLGAPSATRTLGPWRTMAARSPGRDVGTVLLPWCLPNWPSTRGRPSKQAALQTPELRHGIDSFPTPILHRADVFLLGAAGKATSAVLPVGIQ